MLDEPGEAIDKTRHAAEKEQSPAGLDYKIYGISIFTQKMLPWYRAFKKHLYIVRAIASNPFPERHNR